MMISRFHQRHPWNRVIFLTKKQHFGCLSNCRYCADGDQNLPEPANRNVLTVLQISSKSVHLRRSNSRTRQHRFFARKVNPLFAVQPLFRRSLLQWTTPCEESQPRSNNGSLGLYASLSAERHLDLFSRFCRVHGRVSLYYNWAVTPPHKSPFPLGDLDPHLIVDPRTHPSCRVLTCLRDQSRCRPTCWPALCANDLHRFN